MNRLITHTLKTLALLASVLLPLQQSLGASCCGQEGQDCANQKSADSSKSSCSQHDAASGCSKAGGLGRSSYEGDSPYSKSEPGRCSGRCHENAPPSAADPAMVGPCLEVDPSAVTVNSNSTLVCESITRDLLAIAVATRSESGSERCVRLCRYRL